jgi:hypothetical protein
MCYDAPVIPEIARFQQILWAVNTLMGVMLLVLLAVRKNYGAYPAFTFYIAMNLMQAALLYASYRLWGFSSLASWGVAWGSQAAMIFARALAVAELCRHSLSRYPGIWALAKRILLSCAGLVLLYSVLAARHQWKLALPSAERGLELSIATVIVVLFLFTRYYGVRIESADRSLAAGFCLYSCFRALNDTIADRVLYGYSELWSFLGMVAFFGSLFLWSWALRKPLTVTVTKENLLPLHVYQSLTPEINLRLRGLNEQLCRLWKPEVTRH